ncbi:glutamate racemase [Legionella impletisoli]|uniref:Glutamate racemase n=1 Tax=Legionella impletisoli TaxID=343510 RepID=A0A917NDB9_9GAMM|nr:glutamate racemase [Legionella impletisoli]GGI89334.1 glutamate racemase [Legionella impletisoli]
MEQKQSPIGVFDSGMGGLTVLRALKKALPQESFIYLGDTARLPYGTKSRATVQQYAVQMAKVLVEQGIKALVIACNTATTAALPHLQSILPDMPVLGVISPGATAAIRATKNHHIGVLATETTIAAKAYDNVIVKALPKATIQSRACSLLVALAEEGMVDNSIAQSVLNHYLDGFQNEDTIVLGCTHFPVFKPLLRAILPSQVEIVDSAESTAEALNQLLAEKRLLNSANKAGSTQYLVTDSIKRFQQVGELFLAQPIEKSEVMLVDV